MTSKTVEITNEIQSGCDTEKKVYNPFTIRVFVIIILYLFMFYKREFSRPLLREIVYSQIGPN